MANSLFNQMNSQNAVLQQFQTFQKNPFQFLISNKISIPQEFQNDPHGAVQYLLNKGQMSQSQFNQLSQMAQKMGVKLN